jgi:hypothetical protein
MTSRRWSRPATSERGEFQPPIAIKTGENPDAPSDHESHALAMGLARAGEGSGRSGQGSDHGFVDGEREDKGRRREPGTLIR